MNQYRTELKWGLVFVGMSLLWMLGERLAGLHDERIAHHAVYTNLIAIPAILIYWLGLREKRDHDYGGKMSWRQGFVAGLLMTAVVVVLTPVSQWLTARVISPDYFTNAIEYGVANELTTRAEAEQFFSFGNYVLMATLGALVMGVFTSAVVALFVRRSAYIS